EEYEDLMIRLKQAKIYLTMFVRQVVHPHPHNIVNIITGGLQEFHGQIHALKAEWKRWLMAGNWVVLVVSSQERVRRLQRVLGDYGMDVDLIEQNVSDVPKHPSVIIGHVQNGFEFPGAKLVIVTESEVFTQKQRRTRRATK